MSFFTMPAWQPPSGYRIPTWLRPPETMVPGIVPVELLLARTDTDAVLVTSLRAYPTGLEFTLTARPHPDQLHQRRHDPDRPHRFSYHDLWLELRFADGRTASNHPRSWPHTFETEQPDPPFLYYHGSGGSERGWHSRHWLWGLPPPGPLTFVCTWPAGQLQASGVEIDASLVLDAADRAAAVWPATEEPPVCRRDGERGPAPSAGSGATFGSAPHPYQQSRAERHADRCFPGDPRTSRAKLSSVTALLPTAG